MWVLKLGGSLGRDPLLPLWLHTIAEVGAGRLVVVPGGGSFADEVREVQAAWHFSDLAAHNMAVLAMAQYGHQLLGMEPQLVPAMHSDDIPRVLADGRVPVWLPFELQRRAADERTNWEATSDTIALDLAVRLEAEGLVIVKSCETEGRSLAELCAAHAIDSGVARQAEAAAVPVAVINRASSSRLRELLAAPAAR